MLDYTFSMYELEYFLVIFCRVTAFIFAAPFFNTANTPRRIKVALGVFWSYLLYETVPVHPQLIYDTVSGFSLIVIKEVMVGIILGMGCNICIYIVQFAGRLIDMEVGLAMANEYDPTTRQNTSVTGMFYQYIVLMLLLVSGLHEYLIRAFVETYSLIPINGAIFDPDKLLGAILTFMTDFLVVGFRICLPVFAVLLITNCILGIMAKVAPQMNMFAVGMQIKLLLGFGVMFLTIGLLPYIADFIYTEMKTMMVTFVEAMMA